MYAPRPHLERSRVLRPDEGLALKKLNFLDGIKAESESQAETAEEQFDADFTLTTGELSRLLADLVDALGGEARQ